MVLILYAHRAFGVTALSGIVRSSVIIAVGLGIIVPKMRVLDHIEAIVIHVHRHFVLAGRAYRPHTGLQKSMLVVLLACICLLCLTPVIFPGEGSAMLWTLEKQLVPWNF